MANIPANVMELLGGQGTTKTLVTASADGQPHAIVCGSIVAPAADKVVVGEVLMKRASANLSANPKAAILISAGMESYEIVLANPVRIAEGPMLDQMNENLAKINLRAGAIWAFDVAEVYDEGATPNAGSKIA
ncbi:MAG: pyridoxamine 5'-phosphate oxidase family protein [Candidatus Methanomethylophilaceae archaeon]|nr:pyridoxamine 5'-phosphate oxidase family protein [Candidatus Methanomethylophilaceae archaeon]MBQ8643120.1 pyridoxamine 5'-phosphate oxidase family protein [Candidatus Methanomethylophilaceae archaeon]MBR2348039.1 pyridoxamine 5'-phosphate oxidase family protein [Candidatus Methanomethylophilaceae archaeon]